MVWTFIAYSIIALISIYALANTPDVKSQEPTAVTLSEFGIPQIAENQTKRVLMGTKWVTDPLVAAYGNYRKYPIWKG